MKSAASRIKQLFSKIHLILGLVSGLVVFIVATTGCVYVFEEELRNLTQAKYLFVEPRQTPRLSVSELQQAVKRAYPQAKIGQIRLRSAADATAILVTKDKKAISVDPYTGRVVGVRDLRTDFFTVVQDIHMHLWWGKVGEGIVKWNVLIFFILVISGLVLWWPRNRQAARQSFSIKWKAKMIRVNYDLHRVLGFYASWILLLIAWTGIFWTFDIVQNTIYRLDGKSISPNLIKTKSVYRPGVATFPADRAFNVANTSYPGWHQAFISLPKDSSDAYRVVLRYPYQFIRKQNTLLFDQYTGEILRKDLYQDFTTADRIRVSNYDLHTGRMFGIPGKILYFLAGLFAASLPVTGFLVWWNKRKTGRPQRRRATAGKPVPAR